MLRNCARDSSAGILKPLVFPDNNRQPACIIQYTKGLRITSEVGFALKAPVLRIGTRWLVVNAASVPEAAVYEDGDLRLREDDVCPTINVGDGSRVDSIPQSQCVESGSQSYLRFGIRAGVSLHCSTDRFA